MPDRHFPVANEYRVSVHFTRRFDVLGDEFIITSEIGAKQVERVRDPRILTVSLSVCQFVIGAILDHLEYSVRVPDLA